MAHKLPQDIVDIILAQTLELQRLESKRNYTRCMKELNFLVEYGYAADYFLAKMAHFFRLAQNHFETHTNARHGRMNVRIYFEDDAYTDFKVRF